MSDAATQAKPKPAGIDLYTMAETIGQEILQRQTTVRVNRNIGAMENIPAMEAHIAVLVKIERLLLLFAKHESAVRAVLMAEEKKDRERISA